MKSIETTGKTERNPRLHSAFRRRLAPLSIAAGATYLLYKYVNGSSTREITIDSDNKSASQWQINALRLLPFNVISRTWGKVNMLELPVVFRRPVLGLYAKLFRCNMDEVQDPDFRHYKNLSEFFNRPLVADARPVDSDSAMVCPCDGRVLHFGRVQGCEIEQVKGVTYSLKSFLGPCDVTKEHSDEIPQSGLPGAIYALDKESTQSPQNSNQYLAGLKKNAQNKLYHCVIYLAPGDYHGFHSPTEWMVRFRRHFPGDLLSVSPFMARMVQGLFTLNERAVYVGEWKSGFCSMVAVGATNVGSIRVFFDDTLQTNCKKKSGSFYEHDFRRVGKHLPRDGFQLKRGDSFGEFRLGSTIVLVFEAPEDFQFAVERQQWVKYGQALGR